MEKGISEIKATRLRSIDALRGAAALSVVLYHAIGSPPANSPGGLLAGLEQVVRYPLSFGYTGVYLFFVISGYCIHLQWAKRRAAGQTGRPDFWPFWRRRLYRLYPAYLVAILFYVGLTATRGELSLTRGFFFDLGMHLGLVHNLSYTTCYSINSAFWTLAIEEHLYLIYFLLLWLRSRWGWRNTLLTCLGVRVGWYLLCVQLRGQYHTFPIGESAAAHWFTWALGALSVEASFGLIKMPKWCRSPWLGALALSGAIGLTELLPKMTSHLLHESGWLLLDPLWGLGFFLVLNSVVFAERNWQEQVPLSINWLAAVGLFSYSLYLTHQFVLLHAYYFTFIKLPPLIFSFLVLTPLAVGFAWLFFRIFERPFISKPVLKPLESPAVAYQTINS